MKVSTTSLPNWTRASGKINFVQNYIHRKISQAIQQITRKRKAADKNKIKVLVQNPKYPSLRTKLIKGINDLFETSVNMDIRIIWYYEQDRVILLLDVGHHDILRQY